MTAEGSTIRLDSGAIRVLAHPFRSRLLTALRQDGPATATGLAHAFETNSGATSYHLRKLASVGLVEETGTGHGKERVWRAASTAHRWQVRDLSGDPDGQAASDWLRRHYLRSFVERYEAWLAAEPEWPLDWRDAAGGSDFLVDLSPALLAAFEADVESLIERYRARANEVDDPAARPVAIHLHAFPTT